MKTQQTTLEYAIVTQVMLLRLKAGTSDQALATFFKAVGQAQQHIPCLVAVVTGENQSEAHRGFTHGVLLHFDHDPQEAKAHPKYQGLLTTARKPCEQVVIFELPQTLPIPASLLEPTPQSAEPAEAAPKGRRRPREAQAEATPRPPEHPGWRAWSADRIDERLKKIVVEQLGVVASEVTPTASLVEDLNADSLDLVEYIMSVEQVFQSRFLMRMRKSFGRLARHRPICRIREFFELLTAGSPTSSISSTSLVFQRCNSIEAVLLTPLRPPAV